MAESARKREMEIYDETINLNGYEVVRGEFFAHLYEPSITFNNNKISVNMACIRKLPDTEYVQILVNPTEKKLAVRPCSESDKDSFRWCTASAKRAPKQVTCRVFFAKIVELMGWNARYRYKLIGKLVRSNGELLFIFDLNTPEIFVRTVKEDGTVSSSRTPSYPEEWRHQFGVPAYEHQDTLQVDTFDGYALFRIQDKKPKRKEVSADDGTVPDPVC